MPPSPTLVILRGVCDVGVTSTSLLLSLDSLRLGLSGRRRRRFWDPDDSGEVPREGGVGVRGPDLGGAPSPAATRFPPASRSCRTNWSSFPPLGMGPTTPSTTGRGTRAPMGTPPGKVSRRASLLCWASLPQPISHFPEGRGLTDLMAPTALARSWLRCHGLSNTTGYSTKAGARVPC